MHVPSHGRTLNRSRVFFRGRLASRSEQQSSVRLAYRSIIAPKRESSYISKTFLVCSPQQQRDSPPAQVGGSSREPVLDGRVEGPAHHPDAVGHLQAMERKQCLSVARYENLAKASDCPKDEDRLSGLSEKVLQAFEGMPLAGE